MLTVNVKQKLASAFPGAHIEVVDEGADHVGHGATGAHLAVAVVWGGFKGLSRIEQHQMVYSALAEELKGQIHALRIVTKVNTQ